MCSQCFFKEGDSTGWGKGKLYMKQKDGKCPMTAGFPPKNRRIPRNPVMVMASDEIGADSPFNPLLTENDARSILDQWLLPKQKKKKSLKIINEDIVDFIFSEKELFALRVSDDGMIDIGILPDDLVMIYKQDMAYSDELIVAMVGGEKTILRYLRRREHEYFLDASNAKYQPILVDDDVAILGKVIRVVRHLDEVKGSKV